MSESDETDDGSGTGNVTSSTRDNPPFSPAKGGPTHFSDIPVKDLVIVGFMLGLWLYSIALIVRAWAKVHHMPGGRNIFLLELSAGE